MEHRVGQSKGYHRLEVWNQAHLFTLAIYKITRTFPKDELFALTTQIRKAAVSVPANIVEGYSRHSRKEFLQFLFISNGSLAEVEYYLELAKDLGYIDKIRYEQLDSKRHSVGVLLNGFIRSVKSL